MGLVYFKQGLLDIAISTFKNSLSIRLQQQKYDAADIAVVLFNIAAIHLEKGETDKAINVYKQTLDYEYKATNKTKTDIVATLQCLAQAHQLRGDLAEAVEYYEEAVAYCVSSPNIKPNVQIVELLSCIGNIYLEIGNTDKAMEAYTMVLRINQITGIDDHINIVTDGMEFYELIKEHGENAPAA